MSAAAISQASRVNNFSGLEAQAPPKRSGARRVAEIALAPFRAIAKLFKGVYNKINHARKVVVYHVSLAFNVAMNALRPNYWKWWNEIDSNIILGAEPLRNKGHLQGIKQAGVTFVLSKLEDFEYRDGILTKPVKQDAWQTENITLWHSPTVDGMKIDPAQLSADIRRMHQEIEGGGKIYVHCKAGQGRSAMTVIAYYMAYKNMGFEDAYAFVKGKRHQVFLNPMQKSMLKGFNPS